MTKKAVLQLRKEKLVSKLLRYLAISAVALMAAGAVTTVGGTASAATTPRHHVATAPVFTRHAPVKMDSAASTNYCNLPTSAGPGSGYFTSYSDCYACVSDASLRVAYGTSYPVWYCTWNPSRAAADLHFTEQITGNCGLPQSAGPGSGYLWSDSCGNCVWDAADFTLAAGGSPWVYYCTWNPSRGLADMHYGDLAGID